MLRSLKSRKLKIISHKTTDSQNTQHQFKPGLRLRYRFMIKYYVSFHDKVLHIAWLKPTRYVASVTQLRTGNIISI